MELPTYAEARNNVGGKPTPLDTFINEWEPAGKDEKPFRQMLGALLDWACDQGNAALRARVAEVEADNREVTREMLHLKGRAEKAEADYHRTSAELQVVQQEKLQAIAERDAAVKRADEAEADGRIHREALKKIWRGVTDCRGRRSINPDSMQIARAALAATKEPQASTVSRYPWQGSKGV